MLIARVGTRILAEEAGRLEVPTEVLAATVRPGDLVGIDTDMIGPEGYACDISRTFPTNRPEHFV